MIRWNSITETLSTYAPRRIDASIDLLLDHNECPPLDGAPELGTLAASNVNIAQYPDRAAVVALIAGRFNIAEDRVLLTCGGDDVITRCCQATLEPGTNAIVPTPTFEMIPRSMQIAGAEVRTINRTTDASPVDAILERTDDDTRLIAVVSPDNPTGRVVRGDEIRRLARARPNALVLADLAYIEFADDDPTRDLLNEPNIIVVRTFSKAFGLAGLRNGYALGDTNAIAMLNRIGSPYPVSALSLTMLECMLRWPELDGALERRRQQVSRERRVISERLRRICATVIDSQANFILASADNADDIVSAFLAAGIAVRAFGNRPGLRNAFRITCPASDIGLARVESVLKALTTPSPAEVIA